MTLNGVTLILRYFAEFGSSGAHYVKVVKYIDLHYLRQKCSPKNLVSSDVSCMAIFADVTENKCIINRHMRDIDTLRDSL